MPTMFYSMSWDSLVVGDIVEDPALTVPMYLNPSGTLYVKGQFVETSFGEYPPVSISALTLSYDNFTEYPVSVSLDGLNSGSNDWNNTSPLGQWYCGYRSLTRNTEGDMFTDYPVSTSFKLVNSGSGFGAWSGSSFWYSDTTIWGIKYFDLFNDYSDGTLVSGSTGGWSWTSSWVAPWVARSCRTGIRAYDDISLYSNGSSFTASNSQPDARYQNFTTPFFGRTVVTP